MLQNFVYIPEKLPLKSILPLGLSKYTEDACYFIHKIYEQRVLNIRHQECFVPLKAQYMRKVISERRYTDIRNCLISGGILETDGKYVKGEKCLGYRLSQEWRTKKHRKLYLTSKRLISNMEKARLRCESSLTDDQRKMLSLLKYIKVAHDTDSMLPATSSQEQLQAARTSLSFIKDKLWYLIPDKYGRIHTNLTNLSSHLRGAIRVDGESLVELDIKNSQPFFLGILLTLWFTNNSKLIYINSPSRPPSLTMRHFPLDVQHYMALVRDGEFYSYIASQWGVEPHNLNRFKVKLFSEVFFGDNRRPSERASLFRQEFPNVYKVIEKIKERDYRRLAIQLQKVESTFILNKVARTFMDNLPGEFIATIHDSILIKRRNLEIVKDIIDIEFSPWGMVPSLKIKEY